MTGANRARLLRGAELFAPLLLALLLSAVVRAIGFDLGAQDWIYKIGGNSWQLGEHLFWKGLYVGGTLPATLVVFGALTVFALSWKVPRFRRWRLSGMFLVLSAILGPGLIANGLLKEYWGRPRPRELVDFGGRSNFEPVLSIDPSSEGLSFPCGHATMGFFFLAFYFLLRRSRPEWARVAVFGALAAGGLMGIARMTQGAHFFSDAVWAAVVCWYTPLVLGHGLGLYREGRDEREFFATMPRWLKLSLPVLGVGMLAAVLLATPYEEKREYTLSGPAAAGGAYRLRLELSRGRVEIVPGPVFQILARANGHGLPTSKIARNYLEVLPTEEQEDTNIVYTERISGRFTELNADLRIEVPWEKLRRLRIDTGEAEVGIDLGAASRTTIELVGGEGEVTLSPKGQRCIVTPDPRIELAGAVEGNPAAGVCRLELSATFSGKVKVRETSPP